MSQLHPGGLGELAKILPQLLRSMDLSQSTTQTIDIRPGPHGTIRISVPTSDVEQYKIHAHRGGTKMEISLRGGKWIIALSYGVQIRPSSSVLGIEFTDLRSVKSSWSATWAANIGDRPIVLKCGTSSDSESKLQPTLNSPEEIMFDYQAKGLCASWTGNAENCGIGPLPRGTKAPNECEWC